MVHVWEPNCRSIQALILVALESSGSLWSVFFLSLWTAVHRRRQQQQQQWAEEEEEETGRRRRRGTRKKDPHWWRGWGQDEEEEGSRRRSKDNSDDVINWRVVLHHRVTHPLTWTFTKLPLGVIVLPTGPLILVAQSQRHLVVKFLCARLGWLHWDWKWTQWHIFCEFLNCLPGQNNISGWISKKLLPIQCEANSNSPRQSLHSAVTFLFLTDLTLTSLEHKSDSVQSEWLISHCGGSTHWSLDSSRGSC